MMGPEPDETRSVVMRHTLRDGDGYAWWVTIERKIVAAGWENDQQDADRAARTTADGWIAALRTEPDADL